MLRPCSHWTALAWLLAPAAQLAGALRAAPGAVELGHFEGGLDGVLQPSSPDDFLSPSNDPNASLSGRVHSVTDLEQCGSATTLHALGYDSLNDTAEEPSLSIQLDREVPYWLDLDGSQLCGGNFKRTERTGRVALVLLGEAFRARDFFTRRKYDCSNPSLQVQKLLAENHFANIVIPIEKELKMRVDVYLSITPCGYAPNMGVLDEVRPSFDSTETLRRLYGSRVKGVFEFARDASMHDKLADMHVKLDQIMNADGPGGTGVYEYFIMLRYDIYMNRRFTELVSNGAAAHGGLAFYMSTHDFAWSFPGEMWNCMRKFWDGCMRETNQSGLGTVSWERREQLSCFQIGPVSTPRWAQGFAFDQALAAIGKGVNWPGAKPAVKLHRTGCSGFDARGDELRCISGWFWPPRSQWENRFMPYCFHIG